VSWEEYHTETAELLGGWKNSTDRVDARQRRASPTRLGHHCMLFAKSDTSPHIIMLPIVLVPCRSIVSIDAPSSLSLLCD
jgi:hypothetical protein